VTAATTMHLAQINIARCRAPLDSPVMREFVEQLDALNHLAEASPGFVWRLKTDSGNATSIRVYDDPLIMVNLSTWRDAETLKAYAYKSGHIAALKRRRDWFEKLEGPTLALWWVAAHEVPTAMEGRRRLELLATNGPTSEAFNFQALFAPPSAL